MEHQFFLGSRLLDIAGEKGGIIKTGVDVVTGASQPSVIGLFKAICEEKNTRMWRLGKDIRYRSTGSGFHYHGIKHRLSGLKLGLKGKFQSRNAALALGALERLEENGIQVQSINISDGLQKTVWPGRMQMVANNPSILLDGAHNPAAIRALSDSIKAELRYARMILVIGIMEDKEIDQMLKGIVPLSDYVIYTRPLYPRAADPEVLSAKGATLGKPGEIVPHLTKAIERAKQIADPEDLIVICGSLFTVGEVMTRFDPEIYRPDDF
jgi:dihydrofolate synthase/folylpolyglutamate synthase